MLQTYHDMLEFMGSEKQQGLEQKKITPRQNIIAGANFFLHSWRELNVKGTQAQRILSRDAKKCKIPLEVGLK